MFLNFDLISGHVTQISQHDTKKVQALIVLYKPTKCQISRVDLCQDIAYWIFIRYWSCHIQWGHCSWTKLKIHLKDMAWQGVASAWVDGHIEEEGVLSQGGHGDSLLLHILHTCPTALWINIIQGGQILLTAEYFNLTTLTPTTYYTVQAYYLHSKNRTSQKNASVTDWTTDSHCLHLHLQYPYLHLRSCPVLAWS